LARLEAARRPMLRSWGVDVSLSALRLMRSISQGFGSLAQPGFVWRIRLHNVIAILAVLSIQTPISSNPHLQFLSSVSRTHMAIASSAICRPSSSSSSSVLTRSQPAMRLCRSSSRGSACSPARKAGSARVMGRVSDGAEGASRSATLRSCACERSVESVERRRVRSGADMAGRGMSETGWAEWMERLVARSAALSIAGRRRGAEGSSAVVRAACSTWRRWPLAELPAQART